MCNELCYIFAVGSWDLSTAWRESADHHQRVRRTHAPTTITERKLSHFNQLKQNADDLRIDDEYFN
jgi:hypothetical protein